MSIFRSTGRRQRDCPQMYVKTAIILAGFAASYVLLVFVAQTWWQALPLAILLGLATAGIGFNIQHDGGHHAYSDHPWVNKLMAMTLDLIGGSSYLWHWKHGVFHHTYVNITGHDTDIDLGLLGRLTPHQKRLAFHRWQHFYLWPLYGLLAIKWHLFDDFRDVITGRIGSHRIPPPKGWDLVIFLVAGKAVFFALAFGIPLLFHPVWACLFYGVAALVLGMVLSVVFQLAHCVEEAEFPLPRRGHAAHRARLGDPSGRDDGGLRPPQPGDGLAARRPELPDRTPPVPAHLPRQLPGHLEAGGGDLSRVRRAYSEHKSFRAGLASHFRWLRRMGMPTTNDRRRPPESVPSF